MRPTMLMISAIFSLLMIGFGIPFMKRRIPPNQLAGIRVPATLENPDIWYKANAYGGRLMVWIGAVVAIVGIGFYFIPIGDIAYQMIVMLALILSTVVLLVKSLGYVKTLSQRATPMQSPAEVDRKIVPSWTRGLMLAICLFLAAVLLAGGIPMMMGKIAPNGTVGFRTPETLSSPEIWYKANAYSGRTMVVTAAFMGVVALALFFMRSISNLAYMIIAIVMLTVVPMLPVLLSMAYVKQLVG